MRSSALVLIVLRSRLLTHSIYHFEPRIFLRAELGGVLVELRHGCVDVLAELAEQSVPVIGLVLLGLS